MIVGIAEDLTITIKVRSESSPLAKKLTNLRRRNKRNHFQERSRLRWAKERKLMVFRCLTSHRIVSGVVSVHGHCEQIPGGK